MVKVILAKNERTAKNFCIEHDISINRAIIVRSVDTLEGLRFRYEDVIRVPGWSTRADIEEIEERILRTHVFMSYKKE